MSKERWVVSELEKRYGVETTRRWLANLANLGGIPVSDIDRLADLLDVLLTDPQDGDILQYEAASQRWKNKVVSSGFRPVSCVLATDTIDISAPGTYFFKPTGVFNNVYDYEPLTSIPEGLGWSVATDGSSKNITVVETGLYSWTWLVQFLDGNDATFTGEMGDSFGGVKKQLNQIVGCQVEDANATFEFVSAIAQLSAGNGGDLFLKTSTAFTTSPYRSNTALSIARLA